METPFGKIKALFDGEPMVFSKVCVDSDERYFPHVDKSYRIMINIEPDGKEHTLELLLTDCDADGEPETGERLEAVSFYPGKGKITLGCYADFGDDENFDFDGDLKKNGINGTTLPFTFRPGYIP